MQRFIWCAAAAFTTLTGGCVRATVEPQPVPLPPAPSFDSASALISSRQAAEDSVVVTGGRSFLLSHGARTTRVYVLLHGFSDLPDQFAVVGQYLFASGDNVYIPRLPHHGERRSPVRSLGRVRAEELAHFGDSTIAIAHGLGDSIIVIGLSAGAVIAGTIAQQHDVQRAVLIAPAIAAASLSDDENHGLVLLASKLPEIRRTNAPIDSTRPEYLQGITTHGLAQVLLLGQRVRDESAERPAAAKEMIFLLNEADHTVSDEASVDVAQRWLDHGAKVSVYRFPASLKLLHNVMEIDARGGNVGLVFPVVEALARGEAPPQEAELLPVPCRGWRCLPKPAIKR